MLNETIIQGRVVFDVEEKVSPKGTSYCRNVLAVMRNYKNATGEYEADFVPFVCYGAVKDIFLRNVKKGDRIIVKGVLMTSLRPIRTVNKENKVVLKKEKLFVIRASHILFNEATKFENPNEKKKKKNKEYYERKASEYRNTDEDLFHDYDITDEDLNY